MASTDRAEQMQKAEQVLADQPACSGFVRGLFFGEYRADRLPDYPDLSADEEGARRAAELADFCREAIDPVAIDRQAEIPRSVIEGLGRLGVLGACLPRDCGGLGLSQTQYCRLLEVLGGHCGSTALFVNAHHSIGPRAIVLFGTPQQQRTYLPKLATGEWISAFALTEPQAGSDAANVQSTATPTPDGRGYVLRGEKRWITNGSIAQVLTVMARTPIPGQPQSQITAFLVTPPAPGFEVLEARMEKMGVRGTVTSRLAFRDLYVPRENILGPLGKGLKVALTVLDFGRTTFGASCTGAAKFCVARAIAHTRTRIQFGQPLASFELVQEKLARMQALTWAMEACTYQTAALIDAGWGDYMLETAILKVFATEALWQILNDTFQLHGGMAYFTDQPWERMLRDARINTIGEGANDVLRVFTALVGMRDVGLELKAVREALLAPLSGLGVLGRFTGRRLGAWLVDPEVPTPDPRLEEEAGMLARLIGQFGKHVQRLLIQHQESIVDRQHLLGRVADAVIELYVSACVLRRLALHLRDEAPSGTDPQTRRSWQRGLASGQHFLRLARRRIHQALAALSDHDDASTAQLARTLGDAAAG
jgi:alkylation response protein AidB-like acyl-CoA dehydrogenase